MAQQSRGQKPFQTLGSRVWRREMEHRVMRGGKWRAVGGKG